MQNVDMKRCNERRDIRRSAEALVAAGVGVGVGVKEGARLGTKERFSATRSKTGGR